MAHLIESHVESAALAWLEALGWQIRHGDDIAPDGPAAERPDFSAVVLASHANPCGGQLGLSEEELAFYDAMETNDSAVNVLRESNPYRAGAGCGIVGVMGGGMKGRPITACSGRSSAPTLHAGRLPKRT